MRREATGMALLNCLVAEGNEGPLEVRNMNVWSIVQPWDCHESPFPCDDVEKKPLHNLSENQSKNGLMQEKWSQVYPSDFLLPRETAG